MTRRRLLVPLIVVVVLVAGTVAVLRVTGVIGGPPPTATIGVDLPFQGSNSAMSTETFNAMQLYLDQYGGKVGDTVVSLFSYDDSTGAAGTWDAATCTRNAHDHLARADEVAVIGPQHVGCARAEAKILAEGKMVMISPAVTNPGLTKPWGPGEPTVYSAAGSRSFARVVPTDDTQGTAAGRYLAGLGATHCLVVNDGELYGRQLAARFADAVHSKGITVVDGGTWDRTSESYLDLFQRARGVDCVFLSGNFDNNGAQLVADKVAALGDNDQVKLIVPDGFGGYPAFVAMPQAQHAYVTAPGLTLDGWKSLHGNVADFLAAYRAKYHADITSAQSLYGVWALQLVLQAMAGSDGSRAGVHALMLGPGESLPASACICGMPSGIVGLTGDVLSPTLTVGRVDNGTVGQLSTTPLT